MRKDLLNTLAAWLDDNQYHLTTYHNFDMQHWFNVYHHANSHKLTINTVTYGESASAIGWATTLPAFKGILEAHPDIPNVINPSNNTTGIQAITSAFNIPYGLTMWLFHPNMYTPNEHLQPDAVANRIRIVTNASPLAYHILAIWTTIKALLT